MQEIALLGIGVAQRCDGQAPLRMLEHPAQMRAADVSDSDQADSDGWCCHGKTPLFRVILFHMMVRMNCFKQDILSAGKSLCKLPLSASDIPAGGSELRRDPRSNRSRSRELLHQHSFDPGSKRCFAQVQAEQRFVGKDRGKAAANGLRLAKTNLVQLVLQL